MFYFTNSLFKRKSIQKLTQVSIKILKTGYFYFTFKLNEKKKVPFKKYGMERGGLQENLCRRGWLMFHRRLEMFQKRGSDKKGVE